MSGSMQPALGQGIIANLEAKKRELEELQVRQTDLMNFINSLRHRRQELEQLTTSARKALDIRSDEQGGLTLDQEIGQYEEELVNIGSRISAIHSSIELLS
ncbi:hypothetical protein EMCG_06223 [[Emmonsia] crescens]|uniref:Uncharacterized protein n=1 Tax=[Emmonsia] crescens TaxID=73230 RepID=A0A0G2IC53_9EURO|nr:hypothetical protein EMCG_06223 [Emmonsia crescens UAMH 3008]